MTGTDSAARTFTAATRSAGLAAPAGSPGEAAAQSQEGSPAAAESARISLALAPALTPAGIDPAPSFFSGFATQPLVLARGLLALGDITATRYFQYVPTTMRDPVLTANGDRLRAETFSACNGVYARLDLLAAGFDGGDIALGTTNVDLGPESREVLTAVRRAELLHVDVGGDGLTLATPAAHSVERPVNMPDQWVRALGNVAEIHRRLVPRITLTAAQARAFLTAVPAATATGRTVWLVPSREGVRIGSRPAPGAVSVAGLHRLSAAKRLLTHVTGLTVYGPGPGTPETGASAIVIELPSARLTLGLTAEPWRGHSGEGALLAALAADEVLADAELVSALLAFEPVLDVARLGRDTGLSEQRVRGAIAVLAASGRVGWDLADAAHFHRELPDDPGRVDRDQPRLVAARALAAAARVEAARTDKAPGRSWVVRGAEPGQDSVVREVAGELRCGCTWGLTHGSGRGPCKHILAVRIVTKELA